MAGRPKKYHIHLSDKEYKTLKIHYQEEGHFINCTSSLSDYS
jgi:hypothetical protein